MRLDGCMGICGTGMKVVIDIGFSCMRISRNLGS